MLSRTAGFLFALAAPFAALASCRDARKPEPVASLSKSPEAAAAVAKLHAQWEERHPDRYAQAAFLARWPDDGAAPLVTVYLAFSAMDANDYVSADGLLMTIADLPEGTTHDLATVARARSLRVHGAPHSALENLRPLVGKIVDDADREVFLEELSLSAIAAHDDYEALAYLDAWIRGVGEDDKERVRLKIEQILDSLPRGVLEQAYRTMRARGAASGYGPDTQKLVAARLAHIAVETEDAALARWLVDVSGTSAAQTGGDAGLELGELAASRRGLEVVAGKTIGLLLPSRMLQEEAADVVRGISFALDLPRRAGAQEGVRLVTREDGEGEAGTRAAIEELAGEGASIVIAGFDRAGSDRALAFGESSSFPVVALAAPSRPRLPKVAGVVLGERPAREMAMLADALSERGIKTAALVVDHVDDEAASRIAEGRHGLTLLPSVRCDVVLTEASRPRFPVDAWVSAGAHGWLISGPTSCARDVLRDVARVIDRVSGKRAAALTLAATVPPSEIPKGLTVIGSAAGIVPVFAARAEEAKDEDVRAFMTRFGARPSYWTALGHDAGVLARAATATLPPGSTSDPKAVASRRAAVKSAVLGSRGLRFWTSGEGEIGQDRVLARTIQVVDWQETLANPGAGARPRP